MTTNDNWWNELVLGEAWIVNQEQWDLIENLPDEPSPQTIEAFRKIKAVWDEH